MSLRRIRQSGGNERRVIRAATGLFLAGFGIRAFALGLGEPNVASVLGQPLQMTIPLIMDAGAELGQECVRIVPGKHARDVAPSLETGRATIDTVARQIRIDSVQPIVEPALQVAIEVGCEQRIRREFALLLDPPTVGALSPSPSPNQAVSSLTLGTAQISAVLGQPLSFKVAVGGADADSLTAGCVHLADPVLSEGAPVLRKADIRISPQGSGSLIEVETLDPVTVPAVRLVFDVGCQDPLRREYAIALGLPARAAPNAAQTTAAAEPAAPVPQAKTAPKPAVKAPAQAPVAAIPAPDRLVLASPQESVRSADAGGDSLGTGPDSSPELLTRLDTMSRQIQVLEADLIAARQHEQELERRAFETREQWTWSMVALAALLLGGALVMVWRQRRSQPRAAWEPVAAPAPQATAPRPAVAEPRARTGPVVRESFEIAGRATMPAARSGGGPASEPGLLDAKHSEIKVTELHDTVQVIKELYATVLERTTSGAGAASTGGKPSRPLELDLRTPTGVAAPTASPPTPARPDPLERAEKRVGGDRLTELPTAFALDEDVSFEDAAVPEVVLTDLIERGGSDSVPTRRHGPGVADPAGAHRAVDGVSIDSGARAAGATPPIAAAARPDAAARGAGSDDSLTQAPTEALIDIDVGPTTGLSDVMGQTKPKQGAGRNK